MTADIALVLLWPAHPLITLIAIALFYWRMERDKESL